MARVNSVAAAGAAVVLLAGGFALGMVVAGRGAPEVDIRYVSAERPSGASPAAGLPAAPAGAAPGRPSDPPSDAGRAAARALLNALPPPAVPAGSGVVTGRVVKEDGTPLPGALATLTPERSPGIAPSRTVWDAEPDLEATLVESALQARWYRESRRTALSDADGRFRFEGVADAPHGLGVLLRGWRIQPKEWKQARRVLPGADLEFTASPQIEWRVEVVRPDGGVPEQAEIRLSAGGNDVQRMGWSPGSVLYVKPGSFLATAVSGDQQEFRSEPQPVVLEQGAEPPALRFVVRGSPGIRGKVILDGFSTTRGVEVALARIPADGKADPALLSGVAARRETAWANRGGEFLFGDLAPGRYLLGAFASRRSAPLVAEEVEVGDDLATRDLRVPGLDPADFAEIRLEAPGGVPVEATGVTTGYRTSNSSSSGGGSFFRRADGVLLVEHQDTSGIGGGGGAAAPEDAVWWVEIQTASHGSRRVEYRRGPETRLTVAFEEPASLEVTITGLKGSPLEGILQVNLVHAAEAGRFIGSRGTPPKIDAEGRATLPGLQPGEYVLVLTSAGDRSGMRALARVPVTVRSGRNPLSVPVPVLHRVTVSGVDGSVRLMRPGEAFWMMSGNADAEGRAVFDGLPEGRYKVECGPKSAEFDLPGTAEIRL